MDGSVWDGMETLPRTVNLHRALLVQHHLNETANGYIPWKRRRLIQE